MLFEEFVSVIAGKLKEAYQERGMDYDVSVRNPMKVNQETNLAIVITIPGQQAWPSISMDTYYAESVLYGTGTDEIAGRLLTLVEREGIGNQLEGPLFKKDRILDNIRMELIHADKNQELLAQVPHRMVADLALIYRYAVKDAQGDTMTAILNNESIERLGVRGEEELFRVAMEQRRENAPHIIKGIQQVISELGESLQIESNHEHDNPERNKIWSVLTTKDGLYGASCILYPEVVEELAAIKGGNFILLPCSIHEWIVLPDYGIYDELEEMVRCINQNEVGEEEILSDHVYYYDVQKQELSICDTGEGQAMCTEADRGWIGFLS